MKHVRKDQTFVYYYTISRITGESHGLRFSRRDVASFRAIDDNPESIPVGDVLDLPVDPDGDLGSLHDAIGEVVEAHPEVADLLAGRKTIEDVITNPRTA